MYIMHLAAELYLNFIEKYWKHYTPLNLYLTSNLDPSQRIS